MASDEEVLRMVHGAVAAGCAGASIGRNVFQHRSPASMVRAIVSIVRRGAECDVRPLPQFPERPARPLPRQSDGQSAPTITTRRAPRRKAVAAASRILSPRSCPRCGNRSNAENGFPRGMFAASGGSMKRYRRTRGNDRYLVRRVPEHAGVQAPPLRGGRAEGKGASLPGRRPAPSPSARPLPSLPVHLSIAYRAEWPHSTENRPRLRSSSPFDSPLRLSGVPPMCIIPAFTVSIRRGAP